MKSLLRPYIRPYLHFGAALVAIGALAFAVHPPAAAAQTGISQVLHQLNPFISHSSPGYLGVLVSDIDAESAQKFKLTRGALVTLIDHDAPAGQLLHVNDVVISVNGENVEGAEQFSRMLKEMPAGRKVTLVISRDGAQQSITVQLVDRKAMEQDVWNKMNSNAFPPPASGMGLMTGSGDVSAWHMPLFTSSLNVGALVEPLTSQMAEYLGVPSGVMVKQVARKSEAAASGLKAFDVILKVGTESITTSADWDRTLRSNEGKSVQITILRDRHQQTINLQVDSKRHHGKVEVATPSSEPA
jgi:S1-C subfamily serine protease